MDGFEERSSKPWSGDPTVSEPVDRDASWKDFGTSMNAISFGFAATAILISMFLIMAIFEHLIKPRASFFRPQNDALESIEIGHTRTQPIQKIRNSPTVESKFPPNFSVLMPGQRYPTCLAQPAPLPCPREGVHWPPHDHHSFHPP
ncbi:uncharacterized protein LOC109707941 [Ananas comosus]|uniref:Uncharacterized protein LOC109707941 n=1 Tax=Ananas comosus TaxID=4615 RepID=A0A6P5EVC3_ANACO|nr:uncharacterized protein LOC109707941 [Ananas comosus]